MQVFEKKLMKEVFSISNITLQIFLAIPITNLSPERSFSNLSRIKILDDLSILSLEYDKKMLVIKKLNIILQHIHFCLYGC